MTTNGNMPAMPCEVVEQYHIDASQVPCGAPTLRERKVMSGGMTKREMMAMHAPDAPSWFCSKWEDENCQNERFFGEFKDRFGCNNVFMTNEGKKAMYFAWRTHYADELLADLERTE